MPNPVSERASREKRAGKPGASADPGDHCNQIRAGIRSSGGSRANGRRPSPSQAGSGRRFLLSNSPPKPSNPFPPVMPTTATVSPVPTPTSGKITDLEIKDAHLIFESVWQDIEADFGRDNLRFPKEII